MVMATKKVSVTVDAATLDEVRKLAGKGVNLSALVDEALRAKVYRLRLLALLDEMDRENPITPEGHAKGMRLWQRIESASTQEPSRRSRKKTTPSARQSAKH
jgi:post-segregation antitoxin (ccd killing protein)